MSDVRRLFEALTPDPWRQQTPFSEALRVATDALLVAESDEQRSDIMSRWLERNQPCLFGRVAAKMRAISFCFLTETDLLGTDEGIRAKIQGCRLRWTRAGYLGNSSAFVVAVISQRVAEAEPNAAMFALAQRLAWLYLQVDVAADAILHDEVFLEFPGNDRVTWMWRAGVNYFAAHGDGRWWQDHRIPAGLAFSVNSVGHLVKSGRLVNAVADLEQSLGLKTGDFAERKIDSLSKALEFAMRTIAIASNAVSGPATSLLPKPGDSEEPPGQLPSFLAEKDFRKYHGWYHTDFTLPSEYFRPEVQRPDSLSGHSLDFTYLFVKDIENPDFDLMGEGRRIRADGMDRLEDGRDHSKDVTSRGQIVSLEDAPQLRRALALPD